MKMVYQGHGFMDAQLVKHWLERNQLSVTLLGTDRMSLAGEIPIAETRPSVWVADDQVPAATALIQAFHATDTAAEPWICPGCGEENDPNFGSCFQCDGDAPGLPKAS